MSDHKSCYSLEEEPSALGEGDDLSLDAVRAWLGEVRGQSLRNALPRFMIKLERMSKTALPATRRLELLQELKRPLLKLAAGLPKPLGGRQGEAKGLTVEQRLYCLMVKNLKQGMQDLDRSADAFSAGVEKRRRWALRNLYRFLGRQIEYGLFWKRPLPAGTWLEIHDLHSYASLRVFVRPSNGAKRSGRTDFDPQEEYQRLLLLGVAARVLEQTRLSAIFLDEMPYWAARTRLAEPDPYVGEYGLYVVEISRDEPPRLLPGALTETFRGWVMQPAQGFLAYMDALERGEHAYAPHRGMRSVSGLS